MKMRNSQSKSRCQSTIGRNNVFSMIRQLSYGNACSKQFRRKLQATPYLIDHLGLEAELSGHYGCVNCLEWNESGSILASGSDDQDVILWNPFARKKLKTVSTGHTGNIFSVRFLPHSNDTIIATGAGDRLVKVFDTSVNDTLLDCSCHAGRVKRIATVAESPFLLWSAGEDGKILQFDLRQPHRCSSDGSAPSNVLISLDDDLIDNVEAKCIAVNEVRTELLAVGANDPFVRLFDRRYISPTNRSQHHDQGNDQNDLIGNNNDRNIISSDYIDESSCIIGASASPSSSYISVHSAASASRSPQPVAHHHDQQKPRGCLKYFSPGQLNDRPLKSGSYSSTFVTFSPDGQELLANIGAEHVYLFNLTKPDERFRFQTFKNYLNIGGNVTPPNSNHISQHQNQTNDQNTKCGKTNHPKVYASKKFAKLQIRAKMYTAAIKICNESIANFCQQGMCKSCSCTCNSYELYKFYRIRSQALLLRAWRGDIYAAVRDAATSVCLNSSIRENHSAYVQLIRSLKQMQWFDEAWACYNLMMSQSEIKTQTNPTNDDFKALSLQLKGELEQAQAQADRFAGGKTSPDSHLDDDQGHEDQDQDRENCDDDDLLDANETKSEDSESESEFEVLIHNSQNDDADFVILNTDIKDYIENYQNSDTSVSKDRRIKRGANSQKRHSATCSRKYLKSTCEGIYQEINCTCLVGNSYDAGNSSSSCSSSRSSRDSAAELSSNDHSPCNAYQRRIRARAPAKSRCLNRFEQEMNRRMQSFDYSKRFCGHCNITTDIKEANFFGGNGQYIVAGSDDGAFFIWDKHTTNLVKAFKGDDQIVNCLQPHPDICLLATSGIDHVVRLWSPSTNGSFINSESGCGKDREIVDLDTAASTNQQRMSWDPIEALFMFINR